LCGHAGRVTLPINGFATTSEEYQGSSTAASGTTTRKGSDAQMPNGSNAVVGHSAPRSGVE